MAEYMEDVFIHLLRADGHPRCSHILAAVNNAVTNIGVHISY